MHPEVLLGVRMSDDEREDMLEMIEAVLIRQQQEIEEARRG
jgi:hypothetical protein